MKTNIILLTLICGLGFYDLQAQCVANAGAAYQYFCPTDSNSQGFTLGGQPSANGGQAPYTYTWSIKPVQWFAGAPIFYASHFLDDTTAARPKLLGSFADTVQFFLTIEDAQACVSRDSCLVVYSQFVQNLGTRGYTINQGDSVLLQGTNISSNLGPVSYVWRPNRGLIDSTGLSFWAKPSSSVAYYAVATDATGCHMAGGPYHYVTVNSLSAQEPKTAPSWQLYPNPVYDFAQLLYPTNERILNGKLYNSQGQEMPLPTLEKGKINLSHLPAGYYSLHLETARKTQQISFLKK